MAPSQALSPVRLVGASPLDTLEACYPPSSRACVRKQTFQTPWQWRASKKGGQGMLLEVWENILNILSGMAAGWGVALTQPVSPPELEIWR